MIFQNEYSGRRNNCKYFCSARCCTSCFCILCVIMGDTDAKWNKVESDDGQGQPLKHEKLPDVPVKMKKTIGLVNSITIIIGSMIGSGIFVSPTGIVENVHSFGASAYCYAELGTLIHRSGGDYAYHLEAFGPFMGFLRLWIEVMVARPATMAVIGMTFAKYILQPAFPDCEQPETVLRCLSAVCLLILAFINAYSVRLSTRVQDFFTYAKMFALLLIIVTGAVQIGLGSAIILKLSGISQRDGRTYPKPTASGSRTTWSTGRTITQRSRTNGREMTGNRTLRQKASATHTN
ncbi:hypothetical protein EG68_09665 [Paragonimus skrjabini miyazakii]|uniref:Uncharacterized protein n=1 Tax=Paragonimus skrjabini miyazakii TaxID=59628 RepID=A0A8S9YM21_9TREM|nr:hypothetical protein EG68_09665 [Paragonimus skrjabini miyazakii]